MHSSSSKQGIGGTGPVLSDDASRGVMSVLAGFGVSGDLRYLSHAETLRVFERGLVRAEVDLKYSEGFNPRPRVSLVLPRSVGVESDDELLCVRILGDEGACSGAGGGGFDSESFLARVGAELPEGIRLFSARAAGAKVSIQAACAWYFVPVSGVVMSKALERRIGELMLKSQLFVSRRTGGRRAQVKRVDVRGYLKSVEACEGGVVVECPVTAGGSIRVSEILEVLGLETEDLSGPVRRTRVQWIEQ